MPMFSCRSCYQTISVMTCSVSCFGFLRSCCIVVGTSGGRPECIVVETCSGCPYCIRSGKCIPIRVGCIKFVLS